MDWRPLVKYFLVSDFMMAVRVKHSQLLVLVSEDTRLTVEF